MQLKNEKQLSRDQEAIVNHLEDKFSKLSGKMLLNNHENFLNLAKETFDKIVYLEKIEQNKKQNEFLNLINPIKDFLVSFDEKISQIEKDRIESYSDIRRHVRDMMEFQQEIQKETNSLNRALATPFVSGQWGEMQLRRVVEISGMVPYCDFVEQKQSDSSRMRPDMVIKLPGGKNIVLDAKAPIDSYIKSVNENDETLLDVHVKRIKSHIKQLGQKNYWEQFYPTPEFVIMFLPGEAFFSSALKKDPTLIEYGIGEKIITATPITLIALLKTISFAWKQEAIASNASKIGETGKMVCSYLEKLSEFSNGFEKKLLKTAEEYQKINSFIERTITPSANKLKSLGLQIQNKNDGFDSYHE
jgi:DNA recombination protein RmuC